MPGMRKGERGLPRPRSLAALLVLAALLLPVFHAPAAEAARVTSTGVLPIPILGTSSVWTGKEVYAFGGRSDTSYQASIVKYDPQTGTATTHDKLLPTGRQSTSAVWDPRDRPDKGCAKGCAYIFGGAELVQYNDPQFGQIVVPNALRDIIRFNPATGEVRKLTEALPEGVWGTAAVWDASENAAYLFGGFSFDYGTKKFERKDWVVKYKPDADGVSEAKVTNLAAGAAPKRLPFPVQDAGAAVYGGRAYLFGGLATQDVDGTSSAVISDQIVTFNLVTEQVQTLGERMPYGTQFAPAATVGGDIFVFGGRLRNASAAGSIIRYAAASQGPAEVFDLPLPSVRYAMSAASDGASVYLVGGRDGNQNTGGLKDVVTFVPGTTEPTAPRDLRQAGCDNSGVRLTWAEPLYNGGSPVTGYTVYRAGADGIQQNLTFVTAPALTYTDGAAAPGTAYIYRVTATNPAGESRAAAELATTACLRAPSEPRAFEAFAGNGIVHLRWQAPAESGGASSITYRIYRNSVELQRTHTGLTYADASASNDATYTYSVAAVGGGTLVGPAATAPAVTPSDKLPAAPTNLVVARVGTKDAFSLTWDAAAHATSYEVRWTTDLTDPAKMSTAGTSATSFTIPGIQPGLRYYIDVVGMNATARGPPSSLQTHAYVTAPSAAWNLQTMAGAGYVRLQWSAPNQTGGAEAIYYKIFRNETDGSATAVGEEVRWSGTAWVDRNVTGGVSYAYRVVPFAVEGGIGLYGPGAQSAGVQALLASNRPPVAHVLVQPGVHVDKLVDVTFDASDSFDPDGAGKVRRYCFDFGDGSSAPCGSTATVTHRYLADGVYTVKVTVEDDRGDKSDPPAIVQITVGPVRDAGGADPSGGANTTKPPNPVDGIEGARTGFLGLPGPGTALVALAVAGAAALLARRRA